MSSSKPRVKKASLPELFNSDTFSYFGMADRYPVEVPEDYRRSRNRDHNGHLSPIPDDMVFSYGTAGFRNRAEMLTFIVFRMGYLAGLRARSLNKAIGIMITASHNPSQDNGVKIVDPMGEMLAADWERLATELVNADDEQLPTAVRALEAQVIKQEIKDDARVICAMDTRESSGHLLEAARAGAALFEVPFHSHGVLTTPQLHYIVRCENDPSFGRPTEHGYYMRISDAFNSLLAMTPGDSSPLFLDCANGVGAPKMRQLQSHLQASSLTIHYTNEDGKLNHDCGADFVKIDQRLPIGFDSVTTSSKCASFDGDADRLVYFRRTGTDASCQLLDGDRIAALIAKYLLELTLDASSVADSPQLTLGVVQTAYANGASTQYMSDKLKITPVCVPTGVKHLHHAAVNYDMGVYFEANGHGTVVFSEKFKNFVNKPESSSQKNNALVRLELFSRLINEVVGDALADLLAVELILRHYGWTIEDWEKNLYTDFPNIQIKVPVKDRSIYKTTWAETTLIEPDHLQAQINDLVNKYKNARAFVRPSGTENIVRVYAEAATPEAAKELGELVANLVRE